jgi:hypothetical protein
LNDVFSFSPDIDVVVFGTVPIYNILKHRWFAAFDSYGLGQPHFFPGICNVKKFKEEMELRGVKSKPIPTLQATKKA